CTREIAGEEESGVTYLLLLNIAVQWNDLATVRAEVGETGDAARGQRIERPGRDCVDANIIFTQLKGQIAHATLKRGFGYRHDIVFWHYTFTGLIRQRH